MSRKNARNRTTEPMQGQMSLDDITPAPVPEAIERLWETMRELSAWHAAEWHDEAPKGDWDAEL